MGNPRKPTELRELEGNRGHRPIPESPDYPLASIKPPAIVRNTQRRIWNRYAPILYQAGVLRDPDVPAWVITTYLVAEVMDAIKNKEPVRQLIKEVRPWLVEFGMTPASRAKIDIGDPIKVPPGYLD